MGLISCYRSGTEVAAGTYLKVSCGVDLRCPNDCNVVNDSEAKVA